jgi:F0F1-type ATP synthase beta subunit
MGKSVVQQMKEEARERHEFKRKLKESAEKWYDQLFKEQVDELRGARLRNKEE